MELFSFLLVITLRMVQGQQDVHEDGKGHLEVPVDMIPDDVLSLHLDHNEISQVDWFPNYTLLTFLDLSYNNLIEFPNLVNVSITLQNLNLKANNISSISWSDFEGMTELQDLNLVANLLTQIDSFPPCDGALSYSAKATAGK